MGWDWAFSLMRYSPSWRQHRREFHQHFNSTAVKDYAPIMEQQQIHFLDALLRQPEEFLSLSRL